MKYSYRIKRNNDYIFSRWVLCVDKGRGRTKTLDTWYFTTTKTGATIRMKLHNIIFNDKLRGL